MLSNPVVAPDDREQWIQAPPAGETERLRSGAPRVSIITPSFNQARFLEHTIRSVIDQSYTNIEYIVIDGGSTDGSVEIIRQNADRLAFWVSEPDRGQVNAINKGMAHVSGDIVSWVNSDDFYYPGAIAAAVAAFAEDPTLGFTYGRGNRVDEQGGLIERFAHTRPFDLDALIHGIDYILQPTVFMRRGALAEVAPLDATLQWTFDWDLWIRLGRRFPARMLDNVVAASREYAATKTSSGGLERIDEIRRFVRRHTGSDLSVGYLNYLMCTLVDEVRASDIGLQHRIAGGMHQVLVACDRLLQHPVEPGPIRRALRTVVPFPVRRFIGSRLDRVGLLPRSFR